MWCNVVQRLNTSDASASEEVRYRLLTHLSEHPEASQRALAKELGVSVGKVNYCIRALINRGWISVKNFGRANQKSKYLYVLTPRGLEEKVNATYQFLRRRIAEYDAISAEIARLRRELKEGESDADALRG